MCLIAFSWLAHPRWQLVLAGNRDEFHHRRSAAAGWWPDAPGVFGGRDLEAGGSWLALDRHGRLAAVTNFREPAVPRGPRSRGELVAGFVQAASSPEDWAAELVARPEDWSGFNLLLFDFSKRSGAGERPSALYLSNRAPETPQPIAVGVHGLSNELLDCGWPKVRRLRETLANSLQGGRIEEPIFEALADCTPASDDELPSTGLERERERLLSSAMIRGDGYGTRASTLVMVGYDGSVEFVERSWGAEGESPVRETRASFRIDGA